MAEQRSYNGSFNNRWKFTGKELDEETGLYYFGARFYNPVTSLWLSVDPLVEQTMSSYGYVNQNPIRYNDPTGMIAENPGEYEKDENGNWQKVSTKGDAEGLDFYHTDNQDENGFIDYGPAFVSEGPQYTYVTDRKGNWNSIKNGRQVLSGETRSNNINFESIYWEFKDGTGPANSYFESTHPSIKEIRMSFRWMMARENFIESGKSKSANDINFGLTEFVLSSSNTQLQMMGSFNVSFYKLGDKVLNIVQDSKSKTSLYYHLPWIANHERGNSWSVSKFFGLHLNRVDNTEANTRQTYLFLTNNLINNGVK